MAGVGVDDEVTDDRVAGRPVAETVGEINQPKDTARLAGGVTAARANRFRLTNL